MILDKEIVCFYNNIKDPAWPNIQSYAELLKLPEHIKQECFDTFNLRSRINQICSVDYWVNISTPAFVYKNLAFVPIAKCASMHYTTIFRDLGWEPVQLSDLHKENFNFFGTILHPLSRHLKGITQFLLINYNDDSNRSNMVWAGRDLVVNYKQLKIDLSNNYLRNLISQIVIGDPHTMPYHATLGNFMNEVNWIPLDTLTITEQAHAISNFCKTHGHNIEIPIKEKTHKSSKEQNEIFHIVSKLLDHHDYKYQVYKLFGKDLALYYNVIEKFSINWNHITH